MGRPKPSIAPKEVPEEDSASKYKYQPIHPRIRQIRLFRLTKSEAPDSEITGSLEVFDLDRSPAYQALSYMWKERAEEGNRKAILVNGQPLEIWPNLYDFLYAYKELSSEEFADRFPACKACASSPYEAYLWVDQLCIDQANKAEKSQQVQLMGQIYQRATQVVVWLGSEEASTWGKQGLERLQNLRRAKEQGSIEMDNSYYYEWGRNDEPDYEPSDYEAALSNGVDTLIMDPYFRRLWIVQELILARTITILCGSLHAPWANIETWADIPVAAELPGSFGGRSDINIQRNEMLREAVRYRRDGSWRRQRLSDFIHYFCQQQCKDPRDKVYGLLGLLSDEERMSIEPDYDRSLKQLFVDTIISDFKICIRRNFERLKAGDAWAHVGRGVSLFLHQELGLGFRFNWNQEWARLFGLRWYPLKQICRGNSMSDMIGLELLWHHLLVVACDDILSQADASLELIERASMLKAASKEFISRWDDRDTKWPYQQRCRKPGGNTTTFKNDLSTPHLSQDRTRDAVVSQHSLMDFMKPKDRSRCLEPTQANHQDGQTPR